MRRRRKTKVMKREGKNYDDVYDNGNDAEKEGSVSR